MLREEGKQLVVPLVMQRQYDQQTGLAEGCLREVRICLTCKT